MSEEDLVEFTAIIFEYALQSITVSVYAVNQGDSKAISNETQSIYETSLELNYKSALKLNVPEDAEAKAFYQNRNYDTTELKPLEIRNESDGTKTLYFHVSSGSDAYSFRVSKNGKITAQQNSVTSSQN
jgi:hypothetical protein